MRTDWPHHAPLPRIFFLNLDMATTRSLVMSGISRWCRHKRGRGVSKLFKRFQALLYTIEAQIAEWPDVLTSSDIKENCGDSQYCRESDEDKSDKHNEVTTGSLPFQRARGFCYHDFYDETDESIKSTLLSKQR
ncbi:hypothetical protein AC579_3173 [Pseudocercospora musae]|uniref:Uncharacterized protein n=1 Tax=Pseudocercospora musae TaxID=113226 RepID=A0A139IEH4_9PEZI|nr:hypothetical protein AC579_3173 [Pseudocercospora musae]